MIIKYWTNVVATSTPGSKNHNSDIYKHTLCACKVAPWDKKWKSQKFAPVAFGEGLSLGDPSKFFLRRVEKTGIRFPPNFTSRKRLRNSKRRTVTIANFEISLRQPSVRCSGTNGASLYGLQRLDLWPTVSFLTHHGCESKKRTQVSHGCE